MVHTIEYVKFFKEVNGIEKAYDKNPSFWVANLSNPQYRDQLQIYSRTRYSFDGNSAMLRRNVPILIDSLLVATFKFQFNFTSNLPNSGFHFAV